MTTDRTFAIVESSKGPVRFVRTGEPILAHSAEWQNLGQYGPFEYFQRFGDVWRRKASEHNFIGPDGTPNALRWESTIENFARYVAGRLNV